MMSYCHCGYTSNQVLKLLCDFLRINDEYTHKCNSNYNNYTPKSNKATESNSFVLCNLNFASIYCVWTHYKNNNNINTTTTKTTKLIQHIHMSIHAFVCFVRFTFNFWFFHICSLNFTACRKKYLLNTPNNWIILLNPMNRIFPHHLNKQYRQFFSFSVANRIEQLFNITIYVDMNGVWNFSDHALATWSGFTSQVWLLSIWFSFQSICIETDKKKRLIDISTTEQCICK